MRADTIGGVRVSSLRAALDALAHAIATTQGSISVRRWSEHARLDPKTVRRARDVALTLGIIKRVHQYEGGRTDCDAFALIVSIEPHASLTSGCGIAARRGQVQARKNPPKDPSVA
ncbi:hypothetical protein GCM10017567_74270 [Amycolatopsis bullii]|uniref:Uncharacterized protein n=1 Tax=Amycolatopsis bullii TaxID=941987 RepID=A0ABQ3KNR4_9PSEU|nr:hypothetical protein GCM10017567_74270 [Amycolatopsis bullii]